MFHIACESSYKYLTHFVICLLNCFTVFYDIKFIKVSNPLIDSWTGITDVSSLEFINIYLKNSLMATSVLLWFLFFLSRQMSDLLEIYPGIRWALWYAAVPTLFPPYWHVTFINSISTIIYFILICIYTSFLAIKESTSV